MYDENKEAEQLKERIRELENTLRQTDLNLDEEQRTVDFLRSAMPFYISVTASFCSYFLFRASLEYSNVVGCIISLLVSLAFTVLYYFGFLFAGIASNKAVRKFLKSFFRKKYYKMTADELNKWLSISNIVIGALVGGLIFFFVIR